MRLLRLPEKGKRYQSGPTYWKTNFSLSSRKENLSPQEQFAPRAEQRLEIAQGNCTAMLSQIREELNTPTDNEQLLRLKRMSKPPHWGGRYTIGRREKLERKCWEERENKMLGVGRSEEISMRRQFFLWGHGEFGVHCDPLWSPGTPGSPGMRLPSAWLHLTEKAWNQTLTSQVTHLAKHLIQLSWGSDRCLLADPRWHEY